MTLHLEDKWVWDFWFARDRNDFHIFYLQAPRALGAPEVRHWHTSIGHAVSKDLSDWEILPDALQPSNDEDAWDSLTTWTGCTLQHKNTWYMFYTGTNRAEKGLIQRIGIAMSEDLMKWTKYDGSPVIKIDPKWYELYDKDVWYEQAWRDPWVFEYDGKFHALITARSNQGKSKDRGVIGHAVSDDLLHWEVQPPLTDPGEFAYLEVPQLVKIDQNWYLIFCVDQEKYSNQRLINKEARAMSGTHYMIAEQPLGPFRQPFDDVLYGDAVGSYYSGKLIQDDAGEWKLMTAIFNHESKGFVGDISDPMPVFIGEDSEIYVDSPYGSGKRSLEGNEL